MGSNISPQEIEEARKIGKARARRIARRYPRFRDREAELESEHNQCILIAVERYDPGRGKAFAAFAGGVMDLYMRRWLREQCATPKVQVGYREYAPLHCVYAVDVVPDTDSDFAQRLCDREEFRERLGRVAASLGKLPEKERIALTHGVANGWTGVEIGNHLGISESGARKLRNRALDRMRRMVGVPVH